MKFIHSLSLSKILKLLGDQVDLVDTFMARLDDEAEDTVESLLLPPATSAQGMGTTLSELQKADPSLVECHMSYDLDLSKEEIEDAATGYYYNDQIWKINMTTVEHYGSNSQAPCVYVILNQYWKRVVKDVTF